MKRTLIAIAGVGLMASACATGPSDNVVRNAAGGAALGAVAGAIIGNNVGDGDAGRGAAIGAAIGGVAGAVRGSQQDRANQSRYWDANARAYYYCYPQGDCYWENGTRRN